MPPAVYDRLIDEVNAALPTLHRYLKLRARMLEVEDLAYYDVYPSVVTLEKAFTMEESIALTRRALAPLGEEFIAAFDEGVAGGWIHAYPQPGKVAGAYMSGSAYDVHPYVLLNHNDDFESASTFAHEYGHAVHSVLANRAQPYPTAGYSTFIAESASIMNEQLLAAMLVEEAQSPEEKLFYLGQALEAIRGSYFRQAMFGEYEREINRLADAGEPINGERLSALYLETLRRYYGHDAGVMRIDEAYGVEWAYIPHFFYDFYVYQYATSIAAASWFAERILAGDAETTRRFLDMLRAGGSGHAFELMRTAGLDLSEATAHDALERRMNAIMDEMEAILAEQGR
jgi:oligoendopeptidase F